MHFDVNLLTEIFRDTHIHFATSDRPFLLPYLPTSLASTCTCPIKLEFAEGEASHISPLTRAEKRGREGGGGAGRNERTEGDRGKKGEKKGEEKERKVRVCKGAARGD